jgi:hypothetical protein
MTDGMAGCKYLVTAVTALPARPSRLPKSSFPDVTTMGTLKTATTTRVQPIDQTKLSQRMTSRIHLEPNFCSEREFVVFVALRKRISHARQICGRIAIRESHDFDLVEAGFCMFSAALLEESFEYFLFGNKPVLRLEHTDCSKSKNKARISFLAKEHQRTAIVHGHGVPKRQEGQRRSESHTMCKGRETDTHSRPLESCSRIASPR